MGSLAGLLKARGWEVTGSDAGVYPPMSTTLARLGIPVAEGFDARRVLERRPDLVVIGNAVRPDNPEARAALEGGLRVSSFPDALYEHAIRGRHSVVVAGDEYDTVFFDKTPKFLHYHPRTLLLTSVEFDHADIYRDLAHVKSAFEAVVRAVPADGAIV